MKWIAVALTFAFSGPAAAATSPNCVVRYFAHAKLQYNNPDQKAEIITVLSDMMTNTADRLKTRRYADEQGHPAKWDAITLVHRYFVPTPATPFTSAEFYRDVVKPEARKAVRRQLSVVARSSPAR